MSLVRSLLPTAAPAPKAAIGPGVVSIETHMPLSSLSVAPQKLMHEAQKLYRSHVWVASVERAINSRLGRVPYHLERADGETIDPRTASPAERAVLDLIEHPNPDQQRVKTRRGLWSLSSRHIGLCGNGLWYLDRTPLLGGAPLAIIYVNPVRLSEATDGNGNLIGWVVDHPTNPVTGRPSFSGIPLELDQVEHLVLDEPDSGHFGIGIVESAFSKIELSRLADRHAAMVLASGGRLAGLMSPKAANEINNEQWDATQRAWRQIVDDDESAKRLHIVKGPVDFTPTAAKPVEMELKELAAMSRDDVFGAWGVPLSQRGIMTTRGLNSGETVKYEEAALWQGAIDDRAEALREHLQNVVDRFELGLTLVIESPTFDDDAPLYENASKAKVIPLTVNQRLEMVGRDPLDPAIYGDFGSAIFVDQTMVRVDPAGVAQRQAVAEAIAGATAPPPNPDDDDSDDAPPKGSLDDDLRRMRERISGEVTPQLQRRLLGVLAEMRDDIVERVERHAAHVASQPADASVWWDESRWTGRLAEAVDLEPIAVEVATAQSARFNAAGAKADNWIERVGDYVRTRSLERIRGMARTTRDAVQRAINAAVRAGLPANEIATAVRDSAGLDEYRAELIARTEVMSAYNDASLRTFREYGAERVIADDGDDDAECADRNGREYSISEADGIGDHPNGTLSWIPVP